MHNEMLEYIYKHSKKNDKNLKYDFMPELLEIIERPAHIGGKVIIYGIALFILFAFIWAGFSKLDVVATAQASMLPKGNVSTISSSLSGTVQEINVSDGDYVNEGDILIKLEGQSSEAEMKYLNSQSEICETENKLYNLFLKNADINDIKAEDYPAECAASVTYLLETQKYYNQKIERTKQQMGADSYSVEIMEQERRLEIVQRISENDKKLADINIQLEKARLQAEALVIKAPVSGYVSDLSVNTAGNVVAVSQPLMTIVPDKAPLVIECFVADSDIADIRLEQQAAVKLTSYPYSDYGVLIGKVTKISENAQYIENQGNVYVVEVELDSKYAEDEKFKFRSGMTGVVEIKLGKRSVLEYIFGPVLEGLNGSFKEK